MRARLTRMPAMVGLAALAGVAVAILAGGCGGATAGVGPADLTQAVDAPQVTPTADAPSAVPKLTLALNSALDTSPGATKATSITSAQLLNTAKTVVKTATISGGTAQFALTGLAAGHYFIKVNGLGNDLVPTKIDNPAASLSQSVGQRLRNSVIGTVASPTYRITTYTGTQGFPNVVKYSNGTAATPKGFAYVIMQPGAKKLETRYLGTAALLTSHAHSGPHSFATWMMGPTNHGKSTMSCTGCHGSSATHPASHGSIKKDVGWCYKCHYGSGGPMSGMVKPTQ